jgi:hypothetical protein
MPVEIYNVHSKDGRTNTLFKRTEWAKYGLVLKDDDDNDDDDAW